MDNYTRIARQKIAELIRKENFKTIASITNEFVHLDFSYGSPCRVNAFGKVEWLQPDGITPC
jgi:hypothetical protein